MTSGSPLSLWQCRHGNLMHFLVQVGERLRDGEGGFEAWVLENAVGRQAPEVPLSNGPVLVTVTAQWDVECQWQHNRCTEWHMKNAKPNTPVSPSPLARAARPWGGNKQTTHRDSFGSGCFSRNCRSKSWSLRMKPQKRQDTAFTSSRLALRAKNDTALS